MSIRFFFLAALVFLLPHCGKVQDAGTGANGAYTGPMVSGNIISEQPAMLSASAYLTLRLLDITKVDAEPKLLTERTMAIKGLPAAFQLPYDPDLINSMRSYAIEATVTDQGQIRFISKNRTGVLTQGKPVRVDLLMAGVLTEVVKDPVAEFKKEFAEFEARLGALKRLAGSRILGEEGKETAIGWDAFADETGVRMIREQINNADGSRFSRVFAFKDGTLWFAAKEGSGASVKLGWDKDGKLVLQEKNGQPDQAATKQAEDLERSANEALSIAKNKLK